MNITERTKNIITLIFLPFIVGLMIFVMFAIDYSADRATVIISLVFVNFVNLLAIIAFIGYLIQTIKGNY